MGRLVVNATSTTSSVDITNLVVNGAAGFLAGFAVGYAVKKILKVFLLVLGVVLATILYLNYVGIVTVNWERLKSSLVGVAEAARGALGTLHQIAVTVPLAGFAAGFLLGLRYG